MALKLLCVDAARFSKGACKCANTFRANINMEIDYAMDHTFLYRSAFRIRDHDVYRQPLRQADLYLVVCRVW